MERTGVSSVQSGDCEAIYIGQTGRPLQQRLEEHLDSYEKNDEQSAVAWHLLENHHDPAKISIRLIHRVKKGAHLNKLEEYSTKHRIHLLITYSL